MHLHIDGDILVYRAAFAAERTKYVLAARDEKYDEDVDVIFDYKKDLDTYLEKNQGLTGVQVNSHIELDTEANTLHTIDGMIARIYDALPASGGTIYLTGSTNFRTEVATLKKYKGNRDGARKPEFGPMLREHLIKEYNAVVSVDEEADDVIGYTHYGLYVQDPSSTCIVTIDKDLDMLPGRHYNFVKGDAYNVEDDVAILNFWKQMITGDTTDNIPGLAGKGKKFADSVVFDADFYPSLVEEEVVTLYKREFGNDWLKYLNEMGQLLWIRRHPKEIWSYA